MRTLSLFKANVGSFPGGVSVPAEAVDAATVKLTGFKSQGLVDDFRVFACGDNLLVLVSHSHGRGARKISDILWLVFETCADQGLRMHMHGVGEDIFPENADPSAERPGPDCVELEFSERSCEPVVLFATDRTRYGAMNLPILRIFADPMTTRSLVAVKAMAAGFTFEVVDLTNGSLKIYRVPSDLIALSRALSSPENFVVSRVWHTDSRDHLPEGEAVAATSARFKGTALQGLRSDVLMMVRAEGSMPTVGEVIHPLLACPVVPGWRDALPWGPLVPLPLGVSANNFLDGPPKVNALGIHLAGGHIHGPVDLLTGPGWEEAAKRGYSVAAGLSGAFVKCREPMASPRG